LSGCASRDRTGTLLLWSAAIISGTALVLGLVGEFSAVAAVVVTTVRKVGGARPPDARPARI
jgi:hypothetical protein